MLLLLHVMAMRSPTVRSMSRWLRKSDVNSELTIPIASVVAKPLTALEPKNISTRAAIMVVILESRMVQKAFENN